MGYRVKDQIARMIKDNLDKWKLYNYELKNNLRGYSTIVPKNGSINEEVLMDRTPRKKESMENTNTRILISEESNYQRISKRFFRKYCGKRNRRRFSTFQIFKQIDFLRLEFPEWSLNSKLILYFGIFVRVCGFDGSMRSRIFQVKDN